MTERDARSPVLFIFAGLPGSGKSTLARALSRELCAVYIRVDTIEQALRDLCGIDVKGEGYRLGYRIARENLSVGTSVVADSCNPIELTRREWERVALDARAAYVNIEVVCSDIQQHRSRVESRVTDIAGLKLPEWNEVVSREYHPWTTGRSVIDTAGRTPQECQAELMLQLKQMQVAG